MRLKLGSVFLLFGIAIGCSPEAERHAAAWRISEESRSLVSDQALADQIFRALDAAAGAGTNPSISKYPVRAATVVEQGGQEHVIVGGNTEYESVTSSAGSTAARTWILFS